MANQNECEKYPDIYQTPTGSKEEVDRIKRENEKNERIYMAIKSVLETDFDFKALPPDPQSFPGGLKGKEKAQVVSIVGLIKTEWEDPSNGKFSPNTDDAVVKGAGKDEYFVIDRRFIDSVVDAVKEYTSSSDLFNNVFDLMLAEAAGGVPATPPHKAT
jgi:hypothetical protein